MPGQKPMDSFGALSLVAFALLLAVNQVVIKLTNDGIQPVFLAALRSLGGAFCLYAWMRWRGIGTRIDPGTVPAGLLIGLLFAFEFVCLFLALDLTTVTRVSVIFYTMPIWLALGAHLLIPGETLTPRRVAGLGLALAGMVVAFLGRPDLRAGASLWGDLLALGAALSWAGIALVARASALRTVRPERQLLWQLVISAPLLFLAAPLFGPYLRDPDWTHWAGLSFQILAIVTAGFLFWLWLLSIYRAAAVASFSFLSPIFGVTLGWALLGEAVGREVILALVLVCAGLVLVNAGPRRG